MCGDRYRYPGFSEVDQKVKDPYRVVYDLPDDVDVNVTDD